MKYNITI